MRMSKTVVLLLLAGALVLGVLAVEALQSDGEEPVQRVRLATRTPTATRAGGWWQEVATWTPTPTGEVTPAGEATRAVEATATPALDIPPVSTLARPTTAGGVP